MLRALSWSRLLAALAIHLLLLFYLYSQVRGLATSDQAAAVLSRAFPVALLVSLAISFVFAWRGQSLAEPRIEIEDNSAALSAETARLNALLQNLDSGVVLVDRYGNVLLTNQKLNEMFSLSQDESKAVTLPHLLRHYQFVEMWRGSMETRVSSSLSAEVPQSKRYLRGSVFPLQEPLAHHALLLFEDVTELRRLETVRKDFVSNVSHELRTPLTSLKALTESLRAGALEEPETARRFLGHIETEVDALSELVSELLELARTESKEVRLRLEPCDPCSLLTGALDRLRLQSERAGLTLSLDCAPGLPSVEADPPRVEQVLVNLIHNAIKFTPSGGRVTASAKQKDSWVEFSIADTGVGIALEDQARIFERFYKTDPARNKSGTGLGLAIARHVIEAHGGQIYVESQEKRGSRFSFTIPLSSLSPR